MDGLFPDSIPLALRVVAWIVGLARPSSLALLPGLPSTHCLARSGLVRLLPPPNHGKWTKKRTVTFSHVRDFTWRGTKDRDEAWARDVTFDLNAIKDVWYIVDHFSKTKGIAHTMLTFQFLDGKAVTFSFEARATPRTVFRLGRACGVPTNSTCRSVLSGT